MGGVLGYPCVAGGVLGYDGGCIVGATPWLYGVVGVFELL
jgi:hypothetical protein